MAAGSFPRAFVLIAATIGLAARLAFGLGYWTHERMNRDEIEYLSLARSLVAGHGYVYDEHVQNGPIEPFGRAPGYPVFLALVGGGRASSADAVPASVKAAQSVMGALGVVLIAIAAFRMAGRRPAAAAAAIAAVFPPLVWIAGFAYSESAFWPIGLGLALIVSHTLEQPRATIGRWALLSGLATGGAVMFRAATSPFVGILSLWLIWKRQGLALAALWLGLLLVLTPWTIRNWHHYGRLVVIASDGGVTFWTGNNPLATGEGDMAANPHLKIAQRALQERYPGLSEEQLEPIYYRESLGWIRSHPLDWIGLMFKKAFYLVVPIGPSYTLHSVRYYATSVLSIGLLLPLALLGLWRLGPGRARLAGMWLLAAAAVATCLVFFPQERFRIPVIDPALILCASGVWLTQATNTRPTSSEAAV
jgi:4-amino-4-deoxy-L-arabinose transferase-like glycosyltransferase